jgi:hypothetical protein
MVMLSNTYNWAKLSRLQIGKYAEYFVKMEFILSKCDVYSSEVDQHGIDFVIRTEQCKHYDVQVKSFRQIPGKGTPYVFLRKDKFNIHPSLLLALVRFVAGEPPTIWLVPACVEGRHNPIFESRDYGDGKKSAPEWGLTLSKNKLALLEQCSSFRDVLASLE